MARTEKYFIGPKLLDDIRRVIGRVDDEPIRPAVTRIPTRLQDVPRGGGAAAMRYVAWTANWPATVTSTVTFLGTEQTATAVNVFAGVAPGEGWVAKHQGTWHLAVVNLTMQPSYVATDIQLLGHGENGILGWYSVTQCATATAS